MQLIDATQSFPITPQPEPEGIPNPNVVRPPDPEVPTTVGIQVIPEHVPETVAVGSDDICRAVDVAFLKPDPYVTMEVAPTAAFLHAVLGRKAKLEAVSHDTFVHTAKSEGIHTNMLLSAADLCFQAHLPLGLRPEVLWQTVLSQIAIEVKQNPETYRHLFTASGKKETLKVRHDGLCMGNPWGWDQAIGMFRKPLAENVPSDILDLAMPDDMTTVGTTESLGCLMTFMNAASPFYDYRVETRCGIPQVALFGTVGDWKNLQDRVSRLSEKFPSLSLYFQTLDPILANLVRAAEGAAVEKGTEGRSWRGIGIQGGDRFWTSIYKRDSESGGDRLSGWLTAFYAFTRSYKSTDLARRERFNWEEGGFSGISPAFFPGSASVVDFIWDYLGTEYKMQFIGGTTSAVRLQTDEGEFVTPRLGWAVAHAG